MALNINIYLPKEDVDNLQSLHEFVTFIGDFVSKNFGNKMPNDEFSLEDLDSFIIIKDEKLPKLESFEDIDMFLIIPIKDENA